MEKEYKLNELIQIIQNIVGKMLSAPSVKGDDVAPGLNYLAQHRGIAMNEFELANKCQNIKDEILIQKTKLGLNNETKNNQN